MTKDRVQNYTRIMVNQSYVTDTVGNENTSWKMNNKQQNKFTLQHKGPQVIWYLLNLKGKEV